MVMCSTCLSLFDGRCMLTDIDAFFHMNNGTYLQHCDVGRIKMYLHSGVWRVISNLGGNILAAASNNRYRREIRLFEAYTMTSQIVYWDDRAFYVEHKFIRDSDNFVCFIGFVKQTLVGVTPDKLIEQLDYPVTKPDILPEVGKWLESIGISSERLRKKA